MEAGPDGARVTIVIPTTRDAERLRRCLATLDRATRDVPYELVIVLNGAEEEVVRAAHEGTGDARIVVSAVNRGFAGAANLGRREGGTETDAIVLLHDDVEVEEGWLGELLAAADRHPEAGLICPLVLGADGRVQLAGGVMFRDATVGLVGQGAAPDDPAVRVARPVDFPSSGGLLVRQPVWDAVGGLDEHFFPAGYADADLAFSARAAGWDVRVEPAATVRHSGGSTLPPGFKTWVHERNRARFRDRWRVALEEHEPPGDRGPVTVERALDGARRRSERLGEPRTEPAPDTTDRSVDPATLPAREVTLMREYLAERDAEQAELLSRLERMHHVNGRRTEVERLRIELDRLHAEVARLHAEHARRAAELADLHERAAAEIAARDAALEAKDGYIEALLGELGR
jgi:GT2 family glycosyltransferase